MPGHRADVWASCRCLGIVPMREHRGEVPPLLLLLLELDDTYAWWGHRKESAATGLDENGDKLNNFILLQL
jgi:hypothetical protein